VKKEHPTSTGSTPTPEAPTKEETAVATSK